MKEGLVTKALGKHYYVMYDNNVIPCFVRTKLKRQNRNLVSPVAVGDMVAFSLEEHVIESVLPRRSKFSRKASGAWGSHKEQIIASNIDQVIVFFAADKPKPNNKFIDRFLVGAEANEIDLILCFNKWDLQNIHSNMLVDLYKDVGYNVLMTSVTDNFNIDEFIALIKGKTSVLVGPSGAGKSTILNKIEPNLHLKRQQVSTKTGKGKHTTTFAEMFKLSVGASIIDTPGVREFNLYAVSSLELSWLFPEMRKPMENCQYRDCLHKAEPNCGVKKAVEQGAINPLRYESYLSISEDAGV